MDIINSSRILGIFFPSPLKAFGWRFLRRVFKSLSLLKSSLSATSTRVARRFELLGIATLAGDVGKEALGFDDIGGGVVTLAELGISTARVGALAVGVELFTTRVGALAFFPKLGFPLVLHWDMILKQQESTSTLFFFFKEKESFL